MKAEKSLISSASGFFNVKLDDGDWYELMMGAVAPPCRAFAGSFMHRQSLYVFGGSDLHEGLLNDFWRIDFRSLETIDTETIKFETNPVWKPVVLSVYTVGENIRPPALSHHTLCKIDDEALLYGGATMTGENKTMYSFDLHKSEWRRVEC